MTGPKSDVTVRQARQADVEEVVAFTRDTWDGKHGDYIPRVFADWVATDGPTQRTLVVDVDDGAAIAGCCQVVLLSEWEAWAQGLRVNPAYRGHGLSRKLTAAMFDWAATQGASVARNMVFSWNIAGMGQSRVTGFDPCTEFRFAHPEPIADGTPMDLPTGFEVRAGAPGIERAVDGTPPDPEPNEAWGFWTRSAAASHLSGLAHDDEESWAMSTLTRDRLADVADDDRLITVHEDGIAGFTYRDRVTERETAESDDDSGGDSATETWALYGVAAWDSATAAGALFSAIAHDAGAVDADAVRVLIPETVAAVSDVAVARVPVAEEPDFVLEADLTDPAIRRPD